MATTPQPEMKLPQLLKMKEVAQFYGISSKTAYQMAAAGKIPVFRIGRTWRARLEDLQGRQQ